MSTGNTVPGREFHDVSRVDRTRPAEGRKDDFLPILRVLTDRELLDQSSRCTDCGVSFCHSGDTGRGVGILTNGLAVGCPGMKPVPDFINAYHRFLTTNNKAAQKWLLQALDLLESKFRLAGVTGRVCPAPCEHSCVHAQPGHTGGVMIRSIEQAIVDKCIELGIYPIRKRRSEQNPPSTAFGRVAVIGSGPAGYVAADTLNRLGYDVVVYEANDRLGGLMRYGIPRQHGLDRDIVDFYFDVLDREGVEFRLNSRVGHNVQAAEILEYDGFVLATGLPTPKKLTVPGSTFHGVYSSIDVLAAQDRVHEGDHKESPFHANGKTVLIVGRGFTYVDLLGLVGRQGATKVLLSYYRGDLPRKRTTTWPKQPGTWDKEQFYGEEEFANILERHFKTVVTEITGNGGNVTGAYLDQVTGFDANGHPILSGSPTWYACDIVIPSIGFEADNTGLETLLSSEKGVIAGDRRTGPSYVITACQSGYLAAHDLAKKLRKAAHDLAKKLEKAVT